MVVVDAPDPMAASWFEVILQLDLPHEVDVPVEHLSDHLFEFRLVVVSQLEQTPTEKQKGQLMASSIVDSCVVAERLHNVAIQLFSAGGYCFRNEVVQEVSSVLLDLQQPLFECFVAETHGLLNWRCFFQQHGQMLEIVSEDVEFLNGLSLADALRPDGLSFRVGTCCSSWRKTSSSAYVLVFLKVATSSKLMIFLAGVS